jgi:ElaB/YqjD/DUF883 family membrane-anchored ribosome-binding protein
MLNETQVILNRLAVADREHQKEAGGRLLLRSVKYLCAAVVAAFLLDVVFHLDAGWRLGLLLALICCVVVLTIFGWHRAFVRRNRLEHIARFLETRDPALGSRLINLLQLKEQARDESLAPPTRELARQAVENYASELGSVPIENLGRTDAVRRHLKRAAWALLAFAIVLAGGFRITLTEAARFADPFGDHPPYSFTHLEIVQPSPAGTNVLYGKGLIVKVKALGHQPKEIFLSSFPPGHPEKAVTVPMFDEGGTGYNQLLDNVRTGLVVMAHTKDHESESKQVRIGVVLTPQLERTFVRLAPPAYTGLKPAEKLYDFKGVQALEGSEVKFRLQSNRPLREGWLEITAGDQPPQRLALKPSAENEVSGSFIAKESGRLRLGIVDVAGLPSQGDYESALTVMHDLPPTIHITNPEHDAFVAMDFKLQAQIEASDDYGLREIRLHRGLNGVYSAPKVFKHDGVVLDSRATEDFNFADLGIQPGDVITLFAEAVDNAPQPHLARSQTVRLQVISVEDYNNYLREQTDIADTEAKYAQLNDDLQALIEKQKQLGEAAQKLGEQLAKAGAKQREALTQQMDGLLAQQNELNDQLNKQAERMDHFVRDNPLYDVEKDLQTMLLEQAGNIRLSTQDNNAAARDIAQSSSPPSGPRQFSPDMLNDFKKASDEQLARLGDAHHEAEQQMVQKLDDMSQMQELIKDFNLFEALYRTQQDLAQQTQAYNRPGELSREDQLALKDLAATEKQVADTLGQLQGKLHDDAQAAEKLFPKAAQSGRDLADQINGQRMEPLASQTTGQMLAGDGEQSFQLADRLRSEMEKLFGECRGGNCPSSDELDTYLKLQRLNPGNNFAQMSRSRKFGFGKGNSPGQGQGEGMMGSSGFAVMDGSNPNVLGNESSANNGNAAARQSSRFGKGAGPLATGGKGVVEKPDVLKGLNPVNRQSAAESSETVIEEYNDVVDSYFKAITTKQEKPANEKSP